MSRNPRGLRVAADGHEIFAKRRLVEGHPCHKGKAGHDDDRIGIAANGAVGQGAKAIWQAEDRCAAGVDQREGAVERQPAQRHDERLQAAPRDQRAIDEPVGHPNSKRPKEGQRYGHASHHHGSAKHGRQGRNRADRQVDSA